MGALAQVDDATAGTARVDADAVVLDANRQPAIRGAHRDPHGAGAGVPGRVRQRLADHGEDLRRDVIGHRAVDRAGDVEDGPEAERAGGRGDSLAQLAAQGGTDRRPEFEDRPADVADGGVEVVDGRVHAFGGFRPQRVGHGGLQLHAGCEQPLNDDVVQVAGDALAVLQDDELLAFVLGAGPLEGEGGLPGEARQQGRLLLVVLGPAVVLGDDQHAVQGVGPQQGSRQSRPFGHRSRPVRDGSQVVDQPVPFLGERARLLAGRRQELAHELGRAGRRAVGDLDRVARILVVVEQDQHQAGTRHLAGPAGDEAQRLGAADGAEQHRGDLGGGGEPALAALGHGEQAGVVDRDTGGRGQGDHDLLVVVTELVGTLLLREVEVAEDLIPGAHRHTEEAVHRGMVGGEAEGPRVFGDVRQADRVRVGDEQTENAAPVREVADRRLGRGVDSVRDEVGQLLIGADDAERAVTGARERAGRLDDAVESAAQLEVGADPDHGVQQGPEAFAAGHHLADPVEHLLQQLVQAYPGQRRESE